MNEKKSIIRRLIPWLIVIAALAALVVFVFVPIYSQQEEEVSDPVLIHSYAGDGKKLVMENDQLLFEMDGSTTHFQITDKKTGKIWYSNPKDRDTDTIALAVNKEMLSSTLNVTYTGSGGEVELNNYAYSIANQTYDLNQLEDGSIRVVEPTREGVERRPLK